MVDSRVYVGVARSRDGSFGGIFRRVLVSRPAEKFSRQNRFRPMEATENRRAM
jgi:hypothetical protein